MTVDAHNQERFEALLTAWSIAGLPIQEEKELAQLLAHPEHRRTLVKFFHGEAVVYETLRESTAVMMADDDECFFCNLSEADIEADTGTGEAVEVVPIPAAVQAGRSRRSKVRRNRRRAASVSGRDSRSPLVYLLPVAAAILILLVLAAVQNASSSRSLAPVVVTVAAVDGTAQMEMGAGGLDPLRAGMELSSGARLRIGMDSSVDLAYADGTVVTVEERARLVLSPSPAAESGKEIHLLAGSVTAHVTAQPSRFPLRIRTAHAVATVLGTVLRVSESPSQSRLDVFSGQVQFQRLRDSQIVIVNAGEFAVTDQTFERMLVQSATEAERPVAAAPRKIHPDLTGEQNENTSSPRRRPIAVTSFSLIDVTTGAPVPGYESIREDVTVSLATLPSLEINIVANTNPPIVGSVSFAPSRIRSEMIENFRPYALMGNMLRSNAKDADPEYKAWIPTPGTYRIRAIPYPKPDKTGTPGKELAVTITVVK